MKKIWAVFLAAVSLLYGDWIAEGETWIDTETELQWQDTKVNADSQRVWRDARGFCANLSLGGHHDWSLPTRAQLLRLVELRRRLEKPLFRYEADDSYWTNEVDPPLDIWAVYVRNGHTYPEDRCETMHLRCVRRR